MVAFLLHDNVHGCGHIIREYVCQRMLRGGIDGEAHELVYAPERLCIGGWRNAIPHFPAGAVIYLAE